MDALQIVLQFLKEEGYNQAFEALQTEAEVTYIENTLQPHVLRQTLGELNITDQTTVLRQILAGPKLVNAIEEHKEVLTASPVCMIPISEDNQKYILTTFNDGSIKKIDLSGNVILSVKHNISTLLCLEQKNGLVYFGTLSGAIGCLKLDDLSISQQNSSLPQGSIIRIVLIDDTLFAASRNNALYVFDINDLSKVSTVFTFTCAISAICRVNDDGILYSLQNDSMFHFRRISDINEEQLYHMNPNAFDIGAMDIRCLATCPTDSSVFVALTDKCSAYLYGLKKNATEIEVLKVLTHFVSDGLTQPELLWNYPSALIATSEDQTVVAVDIEHNIVAFKLTGWRKATRCAAISDNTLVIGAFDKTVTTFRIETQ